MRANSVNPVAAWAGTYITKSSWWGDFFSPFVVFSNGKVMIKSYELIYTYDQVKNQLIWEPQVINGLKVSGNITFSSRPGGNSFFTGAYQPYDGSGPGDLSGEQGPVSGASIPVSLPAGKRCFYSSIVQSAANQFIELSDSQGKIVFTLTGASIPAGTGNPTPIGDGYFDVQDFSGNYIIKIGTDKGAKWSKVLYNMNELNLGNIKYYHEYVFISEDWSDDDYNDSYLIIYWMENAG